MVSSPSSARGAARVALVVSLGGIALGALLAPSIASSPPAPVALFPPGDTTTVYGPTQLSTPNGNSTNHVERFALAVMPGKRYTLRMVNGAPNGSSKVTGGTVQLNGWETMTSGDLASGATLERVVQVRTEDTLFVTVQGPAGAYVTASVLSTPDASFLVFGPAHFVRTTGTPVTETRTFSISPTAAPPYRFCLDNGDIDGTNRVSSASIVLNGQEVFTQSQFNQHVSSLMTQVALQPANTLLVTLSGQPGGFLDLCVTATDTTPPLLAITAPPQNFITPDTLVTVAGTVQDETPTTVTVNGLSAPVTGSGFSTVIPVPSEGHNTIHIVATDAAGHTTDSTRVVIRDTQDPVLVVTAPPNNYFTSQATITVAGTVIDSTTVRVNLNGVVIPVTNGAFSSPFTLAEGVTQLVFTARDTVLHQSESVLRTVTLDTHNPVIAVSTPAENDTVTTATVTVAGTVTDATAVSLTVNGSAVTVGQGGSFSTSVNVILGVNTITLIAIDQAGNDTTYERHVVRKNPLPPDPATVASVVNRAEATLIKENTSFLYTGTSPIQTGVDTATIKFLRAAVVRGRVLDRQLQPLGGAAVKIKSHPEFGQTLSRDDGRYDLVVNGGGSLVLDYAKGGYLPAQRTVEVPWQDYTPVEDVILVQPDPAVTIVDLTAPGITVARGSIQTDADSSRQATVFFEEGTKAALKHPNGTIDTLTTLNVRATEFTVGENGEDAMPGELPPSSQYTYAVQVTADAQLAEPGATLTFTQPVPLYVENFLGLDSLKTVPVGVYNPDSAKWLPRPNGLMVKFMGTDPQGRAKLDINGDGIEDSDAILAFNGIDSLERVRLAGTFPANSSLWRVPIIEALPHDLNWPFTILGGEEPKTLVTGPCGSKGADVLRCSLQAQTAFQSVGIVGSPFTLNYASDRTRGNVAERSLDIQLVGPTKPPFLRRVDLEITIAGQVFETSFEPVENLSYHFVWDGKDVYGRTVQATQPAVVKVGYLYPVVYSKPAGGPQSFGLPCTVTSGSCTNPAVPPAETEIRGLRRIWEGTETTLGGFDAAGAGLGGFTLDVQNTYDPLGGQLYAGNGMRRATATLPDQITRWHGTGSTGFASPPAVNGLHRLAAIIGNPTGMVVAPDGSVFIVDAFRGRVVKVGANDTVTVVAGTGFTGFNGDSGTATQRQLGSANGLGLGPDGSLYIADVSNNRIRQVTPQGFMRTIAGDGSCTAVVTDTGPAKLAKVCVPQGLGVGPDGSIYFADAGNNRIRRIGPDLRISTVAGLGTAPNQQCFAAGNPGGWAPPAPSEYLNACKDGGPASQAPIRLPSAVAIGPDGSVYFGQGVGGRFDARIRRIDPSGIIRTVAGSDHGSPPVPLTNGDGGSALQARLNSVWAIGIGPDGSIYYSDEAQELTVNGVPQPGTGQNRVRRVRPDGLIQTVVGDGVAGATGDNGPARRARIQRVEGIAFLPDGSMLIGDDAKVRKVSPPLPGLAGGQTVVASADGSELYVFSAAGRILLTLDPVTRDTVYKFIYNANRQLIAITDRNGRTTAIDRDAQGRVESITAGSGATTSFTFDPAGNISSVIDPAGGELDLSSTPDGLLTGVVDYRSNPAGGTYDSDGQLTGATTPAGGVTTRTLQDFDTSQTLTYASPLGRASTVQITESATGARVHRVTLPTGRVVETTVNPDGSRSTRYANGTTSQVTERPDPRFGMQSPSWDVQVKTPSGLTLVERSSRVVTLSDTLDPSTVLTQTDSTIINGRAETVVLNKTTRTRTRRTQAGRISISKLDALGRVVSESIPAFLAAVTTYDSSGRVTSVSRGSRMIRYTYNAAGLPDTVIDVLGGRAQHSYTLTGLVAQTVLPSGDTIHYEYDPNGNRTGVTPPGRPAHHFTFGATGIVESYLPPDVGSGPQPVSWIHNGDGQVTRVIRPDSQEIVVSYDAFGRRQSITDARGTTTFVYDTGTGQVRAINSPEGISLAYEYDGHLRTATLWSGTVVGTVRNTYDANFLVTQETVNGQFPVTYGYDQDGIVNSVGALQITRTAGNGALLGTTVQQVTSTNTLNAFAEPLGLEYRFASNPMIQWTYNRGTTGRIQGITETIAGTTVTTTFGYDAAGRLATATRDGQVQATYEYDANGNRLRVTRPSGSVVGVYDVQDRLLSYGTTQYTYSAVGELLMKVAGADTTRYRYDPSGALVGVRLAQGDSIQYVLDGGGRRVARKVNGVLVSAFIYHNQVAPVAELDGTGAIVSRFVYATSEHVPAYMLKQGRTYRILADHLGSVRMVVDVETGAIAQRIDYDEFGRPTSNTNLGFQPFGYAGGMVDDATGLVHFGMREYDPEVGRWTTKDPILFEGGDGNLYSYVTGDPINLSDPEGTSFLGYFFQKYVIEEILWRIASDVAGGVLGGCFGSWMESGNLAGCPEEAIRGAQFRLSTGFAGGLILHGRYAKRNSLGQFTKGYPRKWNWMENFFVMCLDGAVSGLDVDKVNGDLEQGSDWVSSAAYGCAMGGLGALNELLGKWIIARPALKGRMRIARAVPFVLSSVLDAFGTAFEKRFDAFTEDMMTPGTPCCSENPPGTFVRRLPRRPVGSTEALGSGQEQQR